MDLCKINWELILEYIKVFIWPVLIALLIYIYREEIKLLMSRIAKSKSIKTPFFEADISEATIPENEQGQIDQSFFSLNSIMTQSRNFCIQELAERKKRAKIIFDQASNINVDQLKTLILSDLDELKIAGLISLNSKLQKGQIKITEKDEDYLRFIETSLKHLNSLMRFRAVEVIKNNKFLANYFKNTLKEIDKTEENNAVKMMIRFTLSH